MDSYNSIDAPNVRLFQSLYCLVSDFEELVRDVELLRGAVHSIIGYIVHKSKNSFIYSGSLSNHSARIATSNIHIRKSGKRTKDIGCHILNLNHT